MKQLRLVALIGSLLLSGCSLPSATTSQSLLFLPIAVPIQPSARNEVGLMRIDHLLQRMELTDNDKARLFYERGLINDRLGLRGSARIDFDRSLFFDPAQPDVYNILGVFFTQDAKFDSAYDAFDSALELNEEHDEARRNRGIALYYAGRHHLAIRDLSEYYQNNINDAYRAIWLYFAEYAHLGEKKAEANLLARYEDSDQSDFGWEVARLYLNQISEQEYLRAIQANSFSNQQFAERLCEGYFYLAKRYQLFGKESLAVASFKLAMTSNLYDFIEHRYSLLELSIISEKRRADAAEDGYELTKRIPSI